jgi:transglutaminase-like putative cysteine protease
LAQTAGSAVDGRFLRPTSFIDSDHPAVLAFAQAHTQGAATDRERAVQLFYAVRDRIRYDAFGLTFVPENYKASHVLAEGEAYCIPKAILLAAAARAVGIPSSLGFGDVVNHLASERLLALMESNVFVWHGNTNLFIDGAWRKATPAFNIEMCERFGVKPLEFDGVHDSLLHPFDANNNQHMEYVGDHGDFADFPAEQVFTEMRANYPLFARLLDEGRLREALAAPVSPAVG